MNINDIFLKNSDEIPSLYDEKHPSQEEKTSTSWLALTDTFLNEAQKEPALSGSEYIVLFYMLRKVDYENLCTLPSQKDLSQKLGISVRSISTAMTKLKKKNCIARTKLAREYMLNPYYFYRGGAGPQRNKKRKFTKLSKTNSK